MFRALKYFIIGTAIGFAIFFAGFVIFFPINEAIVMGGVAGVAYGLFCLGFMSRFLKTSTLVVNSENRDPQKSMQWYADTIRSQILEMRFKRVGHSSDLEVYHPTGLYKILERRIELRPDAYSVEVKASKFMIRVLSDLVEIKAGSSLP
ncbi:MAG: hypothetical protein CME64_05165 [Halobacteriovoraceae bacterium]|nr:hypothetical protein [Halobacteriovoraceae bacterium]|tara:strand:+ start:311060 stop:311506 length:447 start_codon:yes stop_codon:yes gene_type:complete